MARRKVNFRAMHVVMIDDIGTKVPHSQIAVEPSVLVETSPDNFQAWYFLQRPERDRLRAELLIDRMIGAGLTKDAKDPGMRGVTRYGRLPVGRNGKPTYVQRLGAAFVQRVVVWQLERLISLDSLAQAYGLDLTPEPARVLRLPRPRKSADGSSSRILRSSACIARLAIWKTPIELSAHGCTSTPDRTRRELFTSVHRTTMLGGVASSVTTATA